MNTVHNFYVLIWNALQHILVSVLYSYWFFFFKRKCGTIYIGAEYLQKGPQQ